MRYMDGRRLTMQRLRMPSFPSMSRPGLMAAKGQTTKDMDLLCMTDEPHSKKRPC